MRVGHDYGHNGPTLDPGAVGPAGTFESTRTYQIGKRLAAIMAKNGYEIVEARTTEDDVTFAAEYTEALGDLPQRVDIFNNAGCIAVISLHCNGAANPAAQGIEIFTTPGETEADRLATEVLAALAEEFPDHALRTDYADGDPDKEANFYVIRETDAPAILVEMEFITNPEMEALLGDEAFQERYAQAVFAGFLAWLRKRG